MKRRANYGLDSPRIVLALLALGAISLWIGWAVSSRWRWVASAVGAYLLLGFAGMLFYSTRGKLQLRERLLDHISWRGDEKVLDVGCGRGLLTVAAARRVPRGAVIGVDVWDPAALTGNRASSVLQNASMEGVQDRVEVNQADARQLPYLDSTFDVVVSNFVVHELKSREDRESMMREVARVLRPGGRVVLADFIFTDDCARDLARFGVNSQCLRDGSLGFWVSAILNFGAVRTYHVVGNKQSATHGTGLAVRASLSG